MTDHAEIELTKGYVALVDREDYERLSKWRWCSHVRRSGAVYAIRHDYTGGKRVTILMHREIVGAAPGLDVDHANHDGLDNRRANLRVASRSENNANQRPRAGLSSGYKGVSWYKRYAKWRAKIQIDGRARDLGYFDSEVDAALAYNAAAAEAKTAIIGAAPPETKPPAVSGKVYPCKPDIFDALRAAAAPPDPESETP